MKSVRVIVSKSASGQLAQLEGKLDVQLELLFSCVVRKRVLFKPSEQVKTYPMDGHDKLNIRFRPVMTKVCLVSENALPDLEDFPIVNAAAYMPRWLELDYRHGKWTGDFGWT